MTSYKGYKYPITKTSKGYFWAKDDLEVIKSSILIILLTNPGERVYLPEFGTPLRDLLFENGSPALIDRARQMILTSIERWEPRVQVDDIQVNLGYETYEAKDLENDHVLHIKILFRIDSSITIQQNLELEVPLPNG